jgi:hypothetical protein
VQVVEEEGKKAIDSPGSPLAFDISPEEYDLGNTIIIEYLLEVYQNK